LAGAEAAVGIFIGSRPRAWLRSMKRGVGAREFGLTTIMFPVSSVIPQFTNQKYKSNERASARGAFDLAHEREVQS
jgi:hypothetical protein